MRVLLDPATLSNTRSDTLLSSSPEPSNPPTPPLTPTPSPSGSFLIPFELINPLSIDVNENDQAGKQSPLSKSKRVTFAPEIVVEDVEIEESVLQAPPDLLPTMNDLKDIVKVSWTELWLSHSALALVLMAATAFYHWLPAEQ